MHVRNTSRIYVEKFKKKQTVVNTLSQNRSFNKSSKSVKINHLRRSSESFSQKKGNFLQNMGQQFNAQGFHKSEFKIN